LESLNVLFVSAEADPYIKVGGLGDVAGSLPLALEQHYRLLAPEKKLDIRLIIPYYGLIHKQGLTLKIVGVIPIATTNGEAQATIHEIAGAPIPTYLVSGDPIRLEDPVYCGDADRDSSKFVFFSLAALRLPGLLKWRVDILHAQDWHSAVAVHELKSLQQKDVTLARCKSVLTIHNLPYMGAGSEKALKIFKVKASRDLTLPEWARTVPLPMGCSAADEVVAVSRGYADEILTPAYSCNLHEFFLQKKNKLSGIVNGLNTDIWDPSSDPYIPHSFTSSTLHEKPKNKTALQKELDLPEGANSPLVIFIGRMDQQKGIDIAVEALRQLNPTNFQVVLLGSGNPVLENACRTLEADFPETVRARIAFDAALSHRLYAAGDIILIPSRYEPCGLVQMIAMRYGCIPVARATGGLKDTINDSSKARTGFLYSGLEASSLKNTLSKALKKISAPNDWREIQKRAMNTDFSWNRSASAYAEIYDRLADY
jgi:starch synthase